MFLVLFSSSTRQINKQKGNTTFIFLFYFYIFFEKVLVRVAQKESTNDTDVTDKTDHTNKKITPRISQIGE